MTLLEKIENKLEEMEDFYPSELIEEAILFADADKSADEQIKTIIEHLQSSVICLDWKESLDGDSLKFFKLPFLLQEVVKRAERACRTRCFLFLWPSSFRSFSSNPRSQSRTTSAPLRVR